MPRAVGPDAARLTTGRDRRRMGRRSRAPDAAFAPVRRLRRIRQARVADVPGPSGPQSLQRAGLLRQSLQSAYESIPNASLSPPRDKSSANIAAFLPAPTNARARPPFSTGGTIWRSFSANPGALRNGAPFAELPPAFRALQQRMLKTPGGDREMVEILALVLQHDEQAVLTAVELALESGVPTKTHILNLLHRLVDGKPTMRPYDKGAPGSDADHRAAGQHRALRRPAQSPGGAPCVIIPPLAPSSSCCEP